MVMLRGAMKITAISIAIAALTAACGHPVAQAASTNPTPLTPGAAPFAQPPVLSGTPDIATLAAKVKPSVVNIFTSREVRQTRQFEFPFGFPFGGGQPHGMPGGPNGQEGPGMRQRSLGTGFIIDNQGHVVTNAHVVEGADEVKVRLADERELIAKVRGTDPKLDIAVLEVEGAKDVPGVSLGSSETLRVGEYVVAVGNPFGLGHTVTMGIVSAKSRSIGAGPYDDFIQTDASINPGNSGGPLFDLRGQVVGINTAINPNGQGIGFAIPVDTVKDVVPQLLAGGHVSRGKLGALIQPIDATMAKGLGLDRPKGALVSEVERGSAGDKAGITSGDVILKVGSSDVVRSQELPRLIARNAPGSKVTLQVLRKGATKSVDVILDALTSDEGTKNRPRLANPRGMGHNYGLELGESPNGDVIVQGVSDVGGAGELRPGDVIVEANSKPVKRAEDVVSALDKTPSGQVLLLKVRRQGQQHFAAVEKK